MLTPSTLFPSLVPCNDLRQRIAARCFDAMVEGIKQHLAQPNPSSAELEDETFLRAVEALVDRLRLFGRPDLADDIEALYYDAIRTLSGPRAS
jgi:hypothetical protein